MSGASAAGRRRKLWGWGFEDEGPDPERLAMAEAGLAAMFGVRDPSPIEPPSIDELDLRPPRISPPASLAAIVSTDRFERAAHTYGKSYRDVVRALRRDFSNPPDLVAFPRNDADIVALLDFCASNGVAAIPFGGGSSVCGGVEPDVGDGFAGTMTIDLRRLDRVLEIDRTSRAARIQAGVFGPALEARLRPSGLTLRHFPQSFEHSTLGGWIATRGGGHFATLHTHIDDFVESLTVVTQAGVVTTRRLPASGAGPDPNRLFIGSEGALGIVTEAWMRLVARPAFRASATATFATFSAGAEAARRLAQSGLYPSNCRLLDPMEAMLNGAGAGDRAVLLVAFESADHPLDAPIARAVALCREAGGSVDDATIRVANDRNARGDHPRDSAAATWRSSFLRAPYLRDALVQRGIVTETFETAVTWDRFDDFHARVSEATRAAVAEACGAGVVTCRLTHVYPDGAAPYFTVIAPARRGSELEQWSAIKSAASETILACGGTITHHHAVGRDFRPWYDRERPGGFAHALAGAKMALDPAGVLNPGVLLAPR